MHHRGHACVRTTRCRQQVHTLAVLELAPPPDHGLIRLADVIVGHLRRHLAVVTTRLVNQCGDDRSKARRVQSLPDAKAQALRGQQVLLGVEPLEVVALRCHPGTALAEVSEVHQQLTDAVEGPGDTVGPALDSAGDPVSLPTQPPPSLGPARVVLAIPAPVAGVLAHLPAQLGDPLLDHGAARSGMPFRWRIVGHLDSHRCRKVLARLGVSRVEVPGHADVDDRFDGGGHIHQGQSAHLAVGGQHRRRGALLLPTTVALDDDRIARAPSAGDLDDVAEAKLLQADRGLSPPAGRSGLCGLFLDVANLVAQRGIRGEVPQMAGHRLGVTCQCLLVPLDRHGHAHNSAVSLELREGRLEDLAGALASNLSDEVDRHVVGRAKAGPQREGARRGQTAHRERIQAAVEQHDSVPLDVYAAPPRAPGQLGVLGRGDVGVRLAVELHQPLQDHGPRRHVDAQGQGLGGEHRPDAAGGEQLLHYLAEGRQHPGVVCREPATEAFDELPVAQHGKVLVGQALDALLDRTTDPGSLGRRDQPHVVAQQLGHGRRAANPAEDERDGRQQPVAVKSLDDLGTARAAAETPGLPRWAPTIAAPASCADAAGTPEAIGSAGPVATTDALQQLRVDPGRVTGSGAGRALLREEVVQALADHHVLPQRDGAVLLDDHRGIAADLAEPGAELLGVAHRGRQRDHLHVVGQVDDHLLPDRAAEAVREVVHLVHHHEAEPAQGPGPGIHHVAQDLGGHHDNGGLTVDRGVAGEQSDLVGAVASHEVGILLVRQGLDRRGVEGFPPGGQCQEHRELPHDGLAGAGGRGHQHPLSGGNRLARLDLEVVEREVKTLGERVKL